jgi:hypothetical protein
MLIYLVIESSTAKIIIIIIIYLHEIKTEILPHLHLGFFF